jgi:putative oxidoreductase
MISDSALDALPRALLVMRLTLGVFLLQWGVEKFVVASNTPLIWGHFYGLSLPQAAAYIFGIVEVAIAICVLLGVIRTMAYGAAAGLHAVSVLVSWRQIAAPWADSINHLFIAGVPVLGAFIALFMLRRWDTMSAGSFFRSGVRE